MPVELICEECGNSYSVAPSRRNSSKFCSNKCKSQHQKESFSGSGNPSWSGGHKVELTCDYCSSKYDRRSDRAENSRFCSIECKGFWQSENLTGEDSHAWDGGPVNRSCEFCNSDYTVKKSKSDDSRFCSQECLHLWKSENWTGPDCPNWEGGHQKSYGPLWNRKRCKVRERDKVCRLCDMTIKEHIERYGRKPDVHHIEPIKRFDSFDEANKMSNLVMLCRACHASVESGKITIP